MRRMAAWLLLGAAVTVTPALAVPQSDLPRIVVVGHGVVQTDPDVALLTFSVRGEGASSDAAATELVRKRAAISIGLAKLLGEDVVINTGDLLIREARDKACNPDDDNQPRLSTGACAIRGFVAEVEVSIRISPVKDAGSALSLASRLGASDLRLSNFSLRDPTDARARAESVAIEDAHTRATGMARAAGSKLGRLISVEDQQARSSDTITVTARRRTERPQDLPIVTIEVRPMPIQTTATLTVTYAVEP